VSLCKPADPGVFEGAHHLAFGIPPADFPLARRWLGDVVEPITVGGSEVIKGLEGWNSESVYFLGPENIILELIARQSDMPVPSGSDEKPQLSAVSEVGVGVLHVPTAVERLVRDLGVSPFPPQENRFAPVGDD
jgi:hypothetical protein